MIYAEVIQRNLQDAALKERMIIDSILILASVEYIQNQLEKKLLEIDEAELYNSSELPLLKSHVTSLLTKLRMEEKRMDEYMAKYKKLVDEKKALLSNPSQAKPLYLRGVPPHQRGVKEGSPLAEAHEEKE